MKNDIFLQTGLVKHLFRLDEFALPTYASYKFSNGRFRYLRPNNKLELSRPTDPMPKADKDLGSFLLRKLNIQQADDIVLLDAIAQQDGDSRSIKFFFKADAVKEPIQVGKGLKERQFRTIANGAMLSCTATGTSGPVSLMIGDTKMVVAVQAPETDLFEGMNVGCAVRNGEALDVTLAWLRFHVASQGMDAALIIDRARPGESKSFAKKLRQGAGKIPGLKCMVLLESEVPLGRTDLPPESHPFNVHGAPGKDRMEIPASDPWSAPLGDLLIYELVRARFLDKARAVANIDIYDLIDPDQNKNVFDLAVNSKTGCISLAGTQCYPWRIRKGQAAKFGDHICVPFDPDGFRRRWCVAPEIAEDKSVWRLIQVVGTEPDTNETAGFFRYMALRHQTPSVSKIVPKASLIEHDGLIKQSINTFAHKPVRMPEENLRKLAKNSDNTTIVTTMKNEGPFILEWIAYHRAIGVKNFLVYTNDCTDGTDTMLKTLQKTGFVQHRENPYSGGKIKPQQAALKAADAEPVVQDSDWLICMDVDEFINIHVGDGCLSDLFKAVGGANMIALTWRLFGNDDIHEFNDTPMCAAFTSCAPKLIRKPHQAWGFKTLYRNQSIFKKLGVHRPKGLKPQLWEDINWVNGSGDPMPNNMFRNGWRSTVSTYGYDLVTLNHYAVRSAESFLVKRDRGRVNHVDRDQGLAYWFRMNNNAEEDRSIQRMLPLFQKELAKLMADPDIAAAHTYSVEKHTKKIAELKSTKSYDAFYKEITGNRMKRLSRLHAHFGANVFLAGPEVIPDEIAEKDQSEDFFFTVEKGLTAH